MEELQIGIENDEGKLIGFKIDDQIINGLYPTYDTNKVKENCKNFDIHFNEEENVKLSKRDMVGILTIKQSIDSQFQFLVGDDLNLEELDKVSEDILHPEIKNLILEAFKLTQKRNLSDFLK